MPSRASEAVSSSHSLDGRQAQSWWLKGKSQPSPSRKMPRQAQNPPTREHPRQGSSLLANLYKHRFKRASPRTPPSLERSHLLPHQQLPSSSTPCTSSAQGYGALTSPPQGDDSVVVAAAGSSPGSVESLARFSWGWRLDEAASFLGGSGLGEAEFCLSRTGSSLSATKTALAV